MIRARRRETDSLRWRPVYLSWRDIALRWNWPTASAGCHVAAAPPPGPNRFPGMPCASPGRAAGFGIGILHVILPTGNRGFPIGGLSAAPGSREPPARGSRPFPLQERGDMPMDRLNRTLAGSGLALLVAATGSGCRSTQSQVPPGRPYTNDGRQGAPVGFSTEPHPMSGAASTPVAPYGGGAPGATGQLGTPAPGAAAGLGAPTGHLYGPPGSSPLGAAAGPSPAPSSGA